MEFVGEISSGVVDFDSTEKVCPDFVEFSGIISFCDEVCPGFEDFSGTFFHAETFSPGLTAETRMFSPPTTKPSSPKIVITKTNTSIHETEDPKHPDCYILDSILQLPNKQRTYSSCNSKSHTIRHDASFCNIK